MSTSVDEADGRDVAPVRPGEELDWASLERYLRGNVPGLEGRFSVLQFPHGAANLTYRVSIGEQRLVIRRPPMGQLAAGGHDMGREFRALSRLWQAYDRAPRPFAYSDDVSIIGAEFMVIEYREGVVIHDPSDVPISFRQWPDHGHRVGMAVVDALIDLHTVDIHATGLATLGKPVGYLERQLRGWTARWDAVADAVRPHPSMQALGDRLRGTVPVSGAPSVLHNDFKLNNCQFGAGPNRVTSVFDWDMATVGDPLVDLGTLFNYWPDPTGHDTGRVAFAGLEGLGLPSREELRDRYARETGFDVQALPWYEAFGAWKTAVIMQQLFARHVRGETTDPRMATIANRLDGVSDRALELLEEWR
jgi:aminoglycoside phosphotransferase (APT) family kinase protein